MLSNGMVKLFLVDYTDPGNIIEIEGVNVATDVAIIENQLVPKVNCNYSVCLNKEEAEEEIKNILSGRGADKFKEDQNKLFLMQIEIANLLNVLKLEISTTYVLNNLMSRLLVGNLFNRLHSDLTPLITMKEIKECLTKSESLSPELKFLLNDVLNFKMEFKDEKS